MKNLLLTAIVLCIFFSCKKEENVSSKKDIDLNQNYLTQIIKNIKDSFSNEDYTEIDYNRIFKSKIPFSNNFMLRIGLVNKKMATDFILIQSDSLGNVIKGRIIHFDQNKTEKFAIANNLSGRFTIQSLGRKTEKEFS